MARTRQPVQDSPAPTLQGAPTTTDPAVDVGTCEASPDLFMGMQDWMGAGNDFAQWMMCGTAEETLPGDEDGICVAEPEIGLDENGEIDAEDPIIGVCEDEPQVCVDADERPDADVLAAIQEPLNYGVFDWAITDGDAQNAISQLDSLSAEQRARVIDQMRASGHLERLLDNLSDEDKEAFSCTLETIPAQDRANELLSTGLLDWAVTDAEATEALGILARVPADQTNAALGQVDLDTLLSNVPADQVPNLRVLYDNTTDPAMKARIWRAWANHNSDNRIDAHEDAVDDNGQSEDIRSDTHTEANQEVDLLLQQYEADRAALPATASPADRQALEQRYLTRIGDMDTRKSHELDIELQHDVRITNEDANRTWTNDELTQIGATLDRLPADHVLGNDKIVQIKRDDVYVENGTPNANVGGTHSDGVITVYDTGVTGGYRHTGDTSVLGDHQTGGTVGHNGLSPLEETLAHEVGHDIHDLHPDIFQHMQNLAGWSNMDSTATLAQLQADGMSQADAQALMAGLDAQRNNPYFSRSPQTVNGWIYEVDPYSGNYLRRREGNIPGDASSPAAHNSFGYAASNPQDHFAEIYSHMVHVPEMVHEDYVERPQQRLAAAQQTVTAAQTNLDALRAPGSTATADQIAAAQTALTTAQQGVTAAQGQYDALSGQWNTMRTDVFGVTPQVESNANAQINTLVSALPPENQGEGQRLQAQFQTELQRAATPDQIQALIRRYQDQINGIGGVCE